MALTEHYHTQFEEGKFYHIYNRSIDRKSMFKNEGNYAFFLNKYDNYLAAVVDTYAYCLLGNHFNLLIRIKDLSTFEKLTNPNSKPVPDIVSHQFRKFFQSYAMAFNKQHNRTGTLFQTPFKRALIDNDQYFTKVIHYTHLNPQVHGLIKDFKEWKWSSYQAMLLDKTSKLKKQEVLEWFGNQENYKQFHIVNQITTHEKYILED
jgi:REP element-mobilizing transposase RayT